jgi:hypothetical protein
MHAMDTAQPDHPPAAHFLRRIFRPRAGSQEAAETMALTALSWLLEDPDRAGRFCAATGLGGADLARYVGDAAFLGGVLDFILEDERLLVELASASDTPPEAFSAARQRLPGAPVRE